MRPLRFRALIQNKDEPKKRPFWVDVCNLGVTEDGEPVEVLDKNCDEWDEEEVKAIVQFTGLKDKNGKDIYEGDIIRLNWAVTEESCEVIFDEEEGAFGVKSSWGGLESVGGDVEVIGNIYENPELLNQRSRV